MNEKKKSRKLLNRMEALEKCRQMEEDIQKALAGHRKYTLPTSKKIPVIDPQIAKDFRSPDIVEKVQEWIMPVKAKEKVPEKRFPYKSFSSSKMVGDVTIEGPKRTGTGISEVLNKSKNNLITMNKYSKELGEPQTRVESPNSHKWNWGSGGLKKHFGQATSVVDVHPDLKTSTKSGKRAEHKPEENTLQVEEKQLTAEEDARRVKRMIAKEKRMKLREARLQWEKDNEIKRSSHKPKESLGDLFYVPVPENRIKPQEFKNNYAKYITNFEQKFQQKISEKFNSGDSCEGGNQREKLKETYFKLLEEAQKRGLGDKLGLFTNVRL